MNSEERKKLYRNLKKDGFCVKCKHKLPKGYTLCYCDFCRKKAREYYNRRKEQANAAHKCVDCGAPAAAGKQRCGACLKKARERAKKKYTEV